MEFKDPEYKQPEEQFKDLFEKADKENAVKVSCPSCGSATPAANINLERLLAKCDACDSVFSVEEKLSPLGKATKPKTEIHHMPEGIEFAEFSDGIDIRAKLKNAEAPIPMMVFLSFFLLFILWFLYIMNVKEGPLPLFITIFFGSSGVGAFMGILHYWMYLKNPIHISVDDYQLNVDFPGFKKNYSIDTDRIEKVYLQEGGATYSMSGEIKKTHNVFIKDDNGLDKILFKNITHKKQASFIVQEINRYLKGKRSET